MENKSFPYRYISSGRKKNNKGTSHAYVCKRCKKIYHSHRDRPWIFCRNILCNDRHCYPLPVVKIETKQKNKRYYVKVQIDKIKKKKCHQCHRLYIPTKNMISRQKFCNEKCKYFFYRDREKNKNKNKT